MNGAVHGTAIGNMTINTSHINPGMMDDDLSDPSSPESGFDTTDLLQSACNDEVTAQLAASGNAQSFHFCLFFNRYLKNADQ